MGQVIDSPEEGTPQKDPGLRKSGLQTVDAPGVGACQGRSGDHGGGLGEVGGVEGGVFPKEICRLDSWSPFTP